jgi:hypothetical protein
MQFSVLPVSEAASPAETSSSLSWRSPAPSAGAQQPGFFFCFISFAILLSP